MKDWHTCLHRALEKSLYRCTLLAKINPDYRLQHVDEARDCDKYSFTGSVDKSKLNPGMVKRVTHEHELRHKANTPQFEAKPKRWNRIVD